MSEFDVELAYEILRQIRCSIRTIQQRFQGISSPADFVSSDDGLTILDAICMQLIAIGESVKNFDRVTDSRLLPQYPQIEWKRVMGMRDIISHHYFDLDAEVVFNVCDRHLGPLAETVEKVMADLADAAQFASTP